MIDLTVIDSEVSFDGIQLFILWLLVHSFVKH